MRHYYKYYISGADKKNRGYAMGILYPWHSMVFGDDFTEKLEECLTGIETDNPVELDLLLCRAIEKALSAVASPDQLQEMAVALSFSAWDDGPASGGVIGCPGWSETPGDGRIFKIAKDLYGIAYPGGPGFVAASEKMIYGAAEILSLAKTLDYDPWPELSAWIEKEGIDSYLYITDGAG